MLNVLIPDGENEHALWTARSLAYSGLVKLHILSNRRWPPVRFSRHCYQRYWFGPPDQNDLARLEALTAKTHIDVILPVSEDGVRLAIAQQEAFARLAALPPLPDPHFFEIARNKWALYQFARQHDLPVPQSVLVTFDKAFEQQIIQLDYPVLLKPNNSTDGQGIRRFNGPTALRQFLATQDPNVFRDKYFVQPFVPGSDFGLSALCQDGEILALTVQRGIISAAHRFGPLMALEFIRRDDAVQIGQRLLTALHWSGVAHIDFRGNERDGSLKILEINARYWGSLLGSLVAGVNFPYLACLAALDIPFEYPMYRCSKYAHTMTAVKQGLLGCVGKSALSGLTFQETGLKFFAGDPLPEIIKKLQSLFVTRAI